MPRLSEVAHLGQAVRDALDRGAPDIEMSSLPQSMNLSAEMLTNNVIQVNSNTPNARQKEVLESLVKHMHAFVREVNLSTDEWMSAIEFLTKTGQTCTDLRQEFILLSDIFGVSALVDTLNHPKPPGATESTVLGPFFVEDAKTIQQGDSIASDGKGDHMLVTGRVLDMNGQPVSGCLVETWETDQDGFYDTQYKDYTADCRGRLYTDAEGNYAFRAVVPVAYPIPNDGPVGQLLRSMYRHVFRPAHLHMMFKAEGFEDLITSLYFEGDIFLTSDAVFGVKSSLVVQPEVITDQSEAQKWGFPSAPYQHVRRDFVLLTTTEAQAERDKQEQVGRSK